MGRRTEWHVLVLVTLALTAFGIVMVYSATSASAVVGGANPMSYLEPEGAGDVCRPGSGGDAGRLGLEIRGAAAARADAGARHARRLRGCSRDRAADQRRTPLGQLRAGILPAVRAREAGDGGVARRVS